MVDGFLSSYKKEKKKKCRAGHDSVYEYDSYLLACIVEYLLTYYTTLKTMKNTMRILPFVALHGWSILPRIASQSCTLCSDGSTSMQTTTAMIGPVRCSYMESLVGNLDTTSSTCEEMNLIGYRYCDCPTYPEDIFCSMCSNGSYDIPNLKLKIPLTNETCENYLFSKRADEPDESCDRLHGAAHYCGCPDAEPSSCSFCPTGQEGPAFSSDKLVPPLFAFSCADWVNAAKLFPPGEKCQSLGSELPINIRAYCGCRQEIDAEIEPSSCSLCSASSDSSSSSLTVLINPNMIVNSAHSLTCQHFHDMALTVTDEPYCLSLRSKFGKDCCGEYASVPTITAPTISPRLPPVSSGPPRLLTSSKTIITSLFMIMLVEL